MPEPLPARRLLLVHGHPDDESISTGATMARYAAEGVRVTLLTCTLGEEGEVLVPELVGLRADAGDQLGGYRIGELAGALEALGVADSRFLGGAGRWRDSGMRGTRANDHPRCLWRAAAAETTLAAVTVLREVRPQVLVTYDENGGYGHPDHIAAHRVATAAVRAAADPAYAAGAGEPWQVAKVYWTAVPASARRSGGSAVDGTAGLPFAVPDEQVTAEVDGRAYLPAKLAGMRAHATQLSVDGSSFALADGVGEEASGTEYYRLVHGERGPAGAGGRETDLFAGLV